MGDILFLAHRVPFPPDRGDKMRSFNLLRHLAGQGRVHLATFADNDADIAHAEALRPLVARMHVERRSASRLVAGLKSLPAGKPVSLILFDGKGLRAFVNDILANEPIDRIFAFSGQMAQFVPDPAGARFVMDFVDMDSAKFADYAERARGPMQFVHAREARRLFAFEKAVARRADISLFVSDAETALFRARTGLGADRVATLENGIDLAYYDPAALHRSAEAGDDPLIVFTGQMDYRPNIEAVMSFAMESFPAILDRHPSARFAIVGRDPVLAVRRLAERREVIVTGAVPDVRPWLAAAAVAVAPLRLARGVQNKVLEAMAMARAVVASPAAFEGIDAVAGQELIVAGQAEEARAVSALLADRDRAGRIGAAARRRIEARYGWESRLARLDELMAA